MRGAHEYGDTTQVPLLAKATPAERRRMAFFGRRTNRTLSDMRRLTPAAREAILVLHHQICLIRSGAQWVSHQQNKVQESVVLALFDRYLVSISVENRPTPRCRYIAKLTELGRLVASALANDEDDIDTAVQAYGEAAQ